MRSWSRERSRRQMPRKVRNAQWTVGGSPGRRAKPGSVGLGAASARALPCAAMVRERTDRREEREGVWPGRRQSVAAPTGPALTRDPVWRTGASIADPPACVRARRKRPLLAALPDGFARGPRGCRFKKWRLGPELNRRTRLCRPLHSHSATQPRAERKGVKNNKGRQRHAPPSLSGIWSGQRDSNSRPQPWQGCALPTELCPRGQLAHCMRPAPTVKLAAAAVSPPLYFAATRFGHAALR